MLLTVDEADQIDAALRHLVELCGVGGTLRDDGFDYGRMTCDDKLDVCQRKDAKSYVGKPARAHTHWRRDLAQDDYALVDAIGAAEDDLEISVLCAVDRGR